MSTKGITPVRSPDPTAKQIAERSAAVRRKWSEAERQRRLAQPSPPVIHWPAADDWLPSNAWDGCPI